MKFRVTLLGGGNHVSMFPVGYIATVVNILSYNNDNIHVHDMTFFQAFPKTLPCGG